VRLVIRASWTVSVFLGVEVDPTGRGVVVVLLGKLLGLGGPRPVRLGGFRARHWVTFFVLVLIRIDSVHQIFEL
jgi:hypothetical protein